MSAKKILEVMGEGIAHGGEEAFINNLISHIDMEGFEIDWLTPYQCKNSFYKNNMKSKGGSIYEFGMTYTPGKNRRHLIKPINQFFDDHHYDVVHIHSGSISALSIISQAAYKHGVKRIIVHSHLASNGSIKSKAIRLAYSPFLYKYPTDYMACSIDAANAKYSYLIQKKKKVDIINNGIELGKYKINKETRKKIREELEIPTNSRVIGHVGRFSQEKNHELIIKCFSEIYRANEKIFLLLVGDGEMQNAIKQMAKDLQIENRIRFAGYVNNIQDYYQAMDIFVLPSFYEGFAIAAIEAQAAGLPCLFSDRLDVKTTINKNVITLPVSENDYNLWAKMICTHIYDEPLCDQSLLIEQGFDIGETAKRIRKVYMEE